MSATLELVVEPTPAERVRQLARLFERDAARSRDRAAHSTRLDAAFYRGHAVALEKAAAMLNAVANALEANP